MADHLVDSVLSMYNNLYQSKSVLSESNCTTVICSLRLISGGLQDGMQHCFYFSLMFLTSLSLTGRMLSVG